MTTAVATPTTTTTTWEPDLAHSLVEFSAKHMMISTVRGRFNRFSGVITYNEANPLLSSAEGSIEAASVDTNMSQRDDHLRSPDFFDVQTHPTITIKTTKVEPQGSQRYKVTSDLTIRGVTKPVVWDVVDEGRGRDPWGNEKWALSADARVNRKDWGLNWNVALEAGGWLVGDEIKVHLEIQLARKA